MERRVGILGAGPGGLAAGLLLQSQGFQVEVFELPSGLRPARGEHEGPFRFDEGPSFLLLPQVLEDLFARAGLRLADHLELKRVDPMYRVEFPDGAALDVSSDPHRMAESLRVFSPSDEWRFWDFRERQLRRLGGVVPGLKRPALRTEEVEEIFADERLRFAFSFPLRAFAFAPNECPSLLGLMPYLGYGMGVWQLTGGHRRLTEVLVQAFRELGGNFVRGQRLKRVLTEGRRIAGVELEDGSTRLFHYGLVDGEYSQTAAPFFSELRRQRRRAPETSRTQDTASSFVIHALVEGRLDWPLHRIFLSSSYRKHFRELTGELRLSKDPSFYVHNPSPSDPTLAPEGSSVLRIVVPVPNQEAQIDWRETRATYRRLVLDKLRERTGVDLEPRLLLERVVTPVEWERERGRAKGVTLRLGAYDETSPSVTDGVEPACAQVENLFVVGLEASLLTAAFRSALEVSQTVTRRARVDFLVPDLRDRLRGNAFLLADRVLKAVSRQS